MTNWITDIIQGIDVGATYKARDDFAKISHRMGLRLLPIYRYDSAFESSPEIHSRIDGLTAGVKRGDVIYYQFPTYNGVRFENFFVDHMNVRGAKLVAIVHDLEFLRFPSETQFDEINFLNHFLVVIVHNDHMAAILRKNGLLVNIVNLQIFDYIIDERSMPTRQYIDKRIILAGSLNKAPYLENWNFETPITVFGIKPSFPLSHAVTYRGKLSPEKIAQSLPSGFGLSWDVNSDQYQNSEEYAKYNNPHKVSLYIASGLPVIVKSGTAISDLIMKYNLGLVVDSLVDIDSSLQSLSETEMKCLLDNVNKFRSLIINGYFTKSAIVQAEFELMMGFPEKK